MKKGLYNAFNKLTRKIETFESLDMVPTTGYQKLGSIHRELTKSDGKNENTMVVCTYSLDDFKNVVYTNQATLHRQAEPKGGLTADIKNIIFIDGSKQKHGRILMAQTDYYTQYKKEVVDGDVWNPEKSYKPNTEWSWVVKIKEGSCKEYTPQSFENEFGYKYDKLPRVTGGIGYIKL
jgi:hypothetical protein